MSFVSFTTCILSDDDGEDYGAKDGNGNEGKGRAVAAAVIYDDNENGGGGDCDNGRDGDKLC